MICTSISYKDLDKCIQTVQDSELSEIRLDLCKFNDTEIQTLFSKKYNLIATCKSGELSDEDIFKSLSIAVTAGAEYLDLEYDILKTKTNFSKLLEMAKATNCKIIISYHNYSLTPAKSELEKIIEKISFFNPDIIKIACKANSPEDSKTILSLYDLENSLIKDKKLISLGMGTEGRITRIAATFLGAPFTYASAETGEETAEGQYDAETLKEFLRLLSE